MDATALNGDITESQGVVASGTAVDPVKIYLTDKPNAKIVRVIHISDTHLHHKALRDLIPDGDILIHSGDFTQICWANYVFKRSNFLEVTGELNNFFGQLPHKHKIFVAGNHELSFPGQPREEFQKLIPNGVYLQDSSVVIEGLKIYGSPWNGLRHSSKARGFAVPYSKLEKYWDLIPQDTDILVTHNPPKFILDLSLYKPLIDIPKYCERCDTTHSGCMHFGCPKLRVAVENLK